MNDTAAPWREVDVVRVRDGWQTTATDHAATEAALEIRLHGQPFVMTMRTPGADADLAAGFLLSEGVITSADDLDTLVRPAIGDGEPDGAIDVALRGSARDRLPALLAARRQVTATSACGICGRPTADALAFDAPALAGDWTMPWALVAALPERLRAHQEVFDRTGGLHAAGVFTTEGSLAAAAEDVGRHNAVDKALGRLLRAGALPLSRHVLCVSGRASFELVQKAIRAGIPMLVAVSAPSTLAIDLARQRGLTLAGFVRGGAFTLYAYPQRVA